ncbi:MAG: Kynureninase [Myxococcota bacterium]|nr:Kynureninase [Myxococcota bacterium]
MVQTDTSETRALRLDADDPLARFRREFLIPEGAGGQPAVYFCGNSLGLQPRNARRLIEEELDAWARLAVEGHFHAVRPWYSYHELFTESGARLVGARPGEVVMMNGLTANLHLMLASFYRPAGGRTKILMEGSAFPSDTYALQSRLKLLNLDPAQHLIVLHPRGGEENLRTDDILAAIEQHGRELALVMFSGVHYYTGEYFDLPRIIEAAHRAGAFAGFDLAHAAGNLPLELHGWNADFAVWCSYKYLNAGPGAVAGCFVHERHGKDPSIPRMAGWWGNDPSTRFRMHLNAEFVPQPGAAGWQLSNPPILALAPLLASLEIFDQAGMAALRAKSLQLTGYLESLLDQSPPGRVRSLTPRDPERRGCQLSLCFERGGRELHQALTQAGCICDYREPGVIRVAPVPLYNSFHDVWRFHRVIEQHV